MATIASTFDDQTDEDFFDKLVNDDIDDQGAVENKAGELVEIPREESLDSSIESSCESKEVGSKGKGVRAVQWSSFNVDSEQFGSAGSGLDSDFLTENLDGFSNDLNFENAVVSNWKIAGANGGQYRDNAASISSSFNASPEQFCSDSEIFMENPDGFSNKNNSENSVVSNGQVADVCGAQYWDDTASITRSLNVGSDKVGLVRFGSDSQLLMKNSENIAVSSNQNAIVNGSQYWDNMRSSSEQKDAQYYGSANGQINGACEAQNWEELYPGWKYDHRTGQWYQIQGMDSSSNSLSENYNLRDEKDKVKGADSSYLKQSAKSLVETVTEECTADNVSNWNRFSQWSNGTPPNIVFDPQYPEWYYDTNTQQWYTLESHNQTIQDMAGEVQGQPHQVNASDGFISRENSIACSEVGQFEQNAQQGFSKNHDRSWESDSSANCYAQQNVWQPSSSVKSVLAYDENQQVRSFCSPVSTANYANQQRSSKMFEPIASKTFNISNGATGYEGKTFNISDGSTGYEGKTFNSSNGATGYEGKTFNSSNGATEYKGFVPGENVYQLSGPKVQQTLEDHLSNSYYIDHPDSVNNSHRQFQNTNASCSQFSCVNEGRSSAGRPPHALVTFGFGGKVVVMKDSGSFSTQSNFGSQGSGSGIISIHNLMEVVMNNADDLSSINGSCGYFYALCRQSFPGPLVGGNAAIKDVNKWLDEKIQKYETSTMDLRKGEQLRLLLSLLKISCQHYGKLRSPFGTNSSLEETDGPESAVTKLFRFSKTNGVHLGDHSSSTCCIQNIPSEGQIGATAVDMQNFLVSGRRKEALHCAQAGQLWGPALVLASQLGEKYYVETVRQMAHHQFTSGSPLRTLCLLIAGKPADVFSADNLTHFYLSDGADTPPQATKKLDSMLDDWEENLAIITANRTKDDELVIVHLGDCLWKERGEITAAHTCYLVAEANLESYSDTARLCLIGADHWKYPRTYTYPEAIQRTEIYEYSKVHGNSQFVLLQFQPYKLVYAFMLAEVGKVSDSLRYCQASLKLLKNFNRAPEVEMWKSLLSSLEERIRTHQQGGYSTNSSPAKLVGKLFTSIDRSINRMMGGPTSPLPPMPQSSVNGKGSYTLGSSQSTMAMSSLIPTASVEGVSERKGDCSRKTMHARSVSEPDFGNSKQGSRSSDAESKISPSRFSRIGSQLLKTVGWVSRSHQAKLGESNKFYYDEKLKRWVEEGAGPPAEEVALPPPPTTVVFQSGVADYDINNALKSPPEAKSPTPARQNSGIPPMSPGPNQFSARSKMGVRSRYVDTFNKGGGGAPSSSFRSPPVPSLKPPPQAKFFVPSAPAVPNGPVVDTPGTNNGLQLPNGEPSYSVTSEESPLSPPPAIQRAPSMNSILSSEAEGRTTTPGNATKSCISHSRRSSWSGGYGEMYDPKTTEPSGNGGKFGDDLQEVAL